MFDHPAFAALIKRKRGEKKWSQENLACEAFGQITRKGDISRYENGKTTPNERTIQNLCTALGISPAEMAPIRTLRPADARPDLIPALSREELQNLAARFGVPDAFDLPDAQLRQLLIQKADETRALKGELEQLRATTPRLGNVVAQAIALLDGDTVDTSALRAMIRDARKVHRDAVLRDALEQDAELALIEARTELYENNPEQAFTLLSAAADAFAGIDPLEPARRRLTYCQLLYAHGLRYGGPGLTLSAQMISTALETLTAETNPNLWASAQNSLAIALQTQGRRTAGPDGIALLARAVAAYDAALAVTTRQDHPLDWAMTQHNRAAALDAQGSRTAGPNGTALLARAVAAFDAAHTVRTRQDHPLDWARTQQNRALPLATLGSLTAGPDGTAPLARAVADYDAALTVRTRQDHPLDWAMTQQNRANALAAQGSRTAGPDGTALLARALATYDEALTVRTRQDHPLDWAMTQHNLALLYLYWSNHDTCTSPRAHLDTALTHITAALTVYHPDHTSHDHATATALRAKITGALAAL